MSNPAARGGEMRSPLSWVSGGAGVVIPDDDDPRFAVCPSSGGVCHWFSPVPGVRCPGGVVRFHAVALGCRGGFVSAIWLFCVVSKKSARAGVPFPFSCFRCLPCGGGSPCPGRRRIAGSVSIRVGRARAVPCWSVMVTGAWRGRSMMMGVAACAGVAPWRSTISGVPWMGVMMIPCPTSSPCAVGIMRRRRRGSPWRRGVWPGSGARRSGGIRIRRSADRVHGAGLWPGSGREGPVPEALRQAAQVGFPAAPVAAEAVSVVQGLVRAVAQ